MKKLISIIVLSISQFYYGQSEKMIYGDKMIIAEERDFTIINDSCFNKIELATKDFLTENYTYFYTPIGRENRGYEEVRKLLKDKQINMDFMKIEGYEVISNPPIYKNNSCYKQYMNYLLKKKYGKLFFEKLPRLADSIYVVNHSNDVFGYANDAQGFSKKPNYVRASSFETESEIMKDDFDKILNYPKDYIKKNEVEFSYSRISFIIEKNDNLSNIEIKTSFVNPINNKHKAFFEKQLLNFITKAKWRPCVLYGTTVRSIMHFGISFK